MPTDPPAPPRQTERLFLALLPSPEALAHIERLRASLHSELGLIGAPIPRERLHLTLHFLGDHAGPPESLVAGIVRVAATVAQRQPAFELRLDRLRSFARPRGRRPLVLLAAPGAASLGALQQDLGTGLAQAGLPHTPPATYTPHITLLYDPQPVQERPLPAPIAWTAHDFVLVRSHIGRGSHEVLARWTLRPAP